MINDISEIEAKLEKLNSILNANDSINNLILILELTREVVVYLEANDLLSVWAKDHIVHALGALTWKWFNLSLTELSLAICDENEISDSNTYSDEIIMLTAETIIKEIDSIKKYFQSVNV